MLCLQAPTLCAATIFQPSKALDAWGFMANTQTSNALDAWGFQAQLFYNMEKASERLVDLMHVLMTGSWIQP